MQEASHHGQIVREYRELKAGITQEELARRIGKSRRTVINIEQAARIRDLKLSRTLAWALQTPPELLGLEGIVLPDVPILTLIAEAPAPTEKNLGRVVVETVKSRYVVPPFQVKVSQSRAGQDPSILQLAPGQMCKGEGKLIDR